MRFRFFVFSLIAAFVGFLFLVPPRVQAAGSCSIDMAVQPAGQVRGPFSDQSQSLQWNDTLYIRIKDLSEAPNDKLYVVADKYDDGRTAPGSAGGYFSLQNSGVMSEDSEGNHIVQLSGDNLKFFIRTLNSSTRARVIWWNFNYEDVYCTSVGAITVRNPVCSLTTAVYRKPLDRGAESGYSLAVSGDLSDFPKEKKYRVEFYNGARIIFTESVPASTFGFVKSDFNADYKNQTHKLSLLDENGTHLCSKDVTFPENAPIKDPREITPPTPVAEVLPHLASFDFCAQLPEGPSRTSCEACIQPENNDPLKPKAMYTALGCIRVDNQGLVRQIIQILLSIAGLVALLSILAGAFIFTTSQGDSNKVKQAKELITAAVSGILFIVFSTLILDFIGVQILRLPGIS